MLACLNNLENLYIGTTIQFDNEEQQLCFATQISTMKKLKSLRFSQKYRIHQGYIELLCQNKPKGFSLETPVKLSFYDYSKLIIINRSAKMSGIVKILEKPVWKVLMT